jgi:hypothetical protein
MARSDLPLPQRRTLFETMRRDLWWGPPLATFLGLMAFIVYSTWAAIQNEHYLYMGEGRRREGGVSRGLSLAVLRAGAVDRCGFATMKHVSAARPRRTFSWFGIKPEWWPWIIPFSPAFLILWAPGGFRLTCYYYRGAYYKVVLG